MEQAWIPGLIAVLVGLLAGCSENAIEQPAAPPVPPVTMETVRVQDLHGGPVNPFKSEQANLMVMLFARVDCPISNRYAPEVKRLHDEYAPRQVSFWLVYPDPDRTVAAIRQHMEEFGYEMAAVRDADHHLVGLVEATTTPEAAVFARQAAGEPWALVYHGRIDNRASDLGRQRRKPTRRDLAEALDACLTGDHTRRASQTPIGCPIEDLK